MNQKIAIIADNSVEYVQYLFKIWNDGNCAVLIDYKFPWEKIVELLKLADVKFCYIDNKITNKISTTSIPYKEMKSMNGITRVWIEENYAFLSNYSKEDALILFSSGTTGKTKGIVLSFEAIQINSDMVAEYMRISDKDNMYIIKSLTHSATLVGELLVAVKTKVNLYISSTMYSIRNLVDRINEFEISLICVNPTILSMIIEFIHKYRLEMKSLTRIFTSGSILSPKLYEDFRRVIPKTELYNVYGLTECGPRVAAQTPGISWSNSSVGRVLNRVDVEIRDNRNERTGVGIIWIKSPSLFTRYLDKPAVLDERGYFCSNDVGYFMNEQLVIVGRNDNMIISGSHNVYPEQIEACINELSYVKECIVWGQDDDKYGKRIECLYVADVNCKEEIRKHCVKKMANYEIPHNFIRVEKLIKNSNGKVLRKVNIGDYEILD